MMPDFIIQIGLLFYPLLILSVVGCGIIIERIVFFMTLPPLQKDRRVQALQDELDANAALDKPIRDEIMSFRLAALKGRWEYGLHVLRLIAVLTPMIGLLGTVLGMIAVFHDIAALTTPVSPNVIAAGLWEAMLTTAYGLSIALPCLFAAFAFARIAEKRLDACQTMLNKQSLAMEGAVLT